MTDCTVAPFSDKLMLFQTTYMNMVGIGNYGMAIGTCQRIDLGAIFSKLAAEIALFAEDGAKLLIKNGWLEEPPKAVNREKLMERPEINKFDRGKLIERPKANLFNSQNKEAQRRFSCFLKFCEP